MQQNYFEKLISDPFFQSFPPPPPLIWHPKYQQCINVSPPPDPKHELNSSNPIVTLYSLRQFLILSSRISLDFPKLSLPLSSKEKKSKAILVPGLRLTQGSETSRIPQFLDSQLRDGAEVSLTRRAPFTP
jgi:hypothetical protein